MDIQIYLEGVEFIQIGDAADAEPIAYDVCTDFGTVHCSCLSSCHMGPGNFIVCMGEEPHKPGIASSGSRLLKKCVFKVHV